MCTDYRSTCALVRCVESAGANEALKEPEFSDYRATIEQQRQQVGTGAAAGARTGRGSRYVSEEEAMLQYAIHMSLMEQQAQQGASGPEGQQGDASQPQVVPGELSPVDAALLVPDEVDENALLQQAIAASLALQQGPAARLLVQRRFRPTQLQCRPLNSHLLLRALSRLRGPDRR